MTDDLHRALTGALDKTTGLRGVGSTLDPPGPTGPTGPVCSCPTDLAEILQRTLEHRPAYCPTHAPDGTAAAPAADLAATLDRAIAGHHDTPPAPTGGDVALNSPSLEQSVAAALGATVHTPHHD